MDTTPDVPDPRLEAWHAECDAVGIPHDPKSLVRHTRNNGILQGSTEMLLSIIDAWKARCAATGEDPDWRWMLADRVDADTHLTGLTFIDGRRAWWSKHIAEANRPDEILVQRGADGGGVDYEFAFRLHRLRSGDAIRAEVFDDAFDTFTEDAPLWNAVGERKPTTLDDVVDILTSLGARDTTPTEDPYA